MKNSNDTKPLIRKLTAIVLLITSANTYAEPAVQLSLKPGQCVALQQGQKCYVDVKLHWQATSVGHYCLYSSQFEAALKCWQNTTIGYYNKDVVGNENIDFSIRRKSDDKVLASKTLEMAWVYKKSRHSQVSWRMF